MCAELGFEPTTDQSVFIEHLFRFLYSSDVSELLLLKGYAGTGKTSIIAALTKVLRRQKHKTILLAPTGRAAKVLSAYSAKKSFTIHRKIFRKYSDSEGIVRFGVAENTHTNTLFIVDEASMIGDERNGFTGNSLLSDLLEYIYSGDNCKLLFCGDVAQLPPVGTTLSPALNPEYLRNNYSFSIHSCELKEVVRQAADSGILFNATSLRVQLMQTERQSPQLQEFSDVIKINGSELEDALNSAYARYSEENVLVVTRSNKRANQFNQQIRMRIKYRDELINGGDLMIVVKNNYQALDENSKAGFIANGDAIEILKVIRIKEMYGMQFAEVVFRMLDYPEEPEINFLLNLSVIDSEHPSMTQEQQRMFAALVLQDIGPNATRAEQISYLRKNPYYSALQVKFSYAVTCHKSQGGQWPCVFIDKGFIPQGESNEDYYRWLYTAITRATEKVYLINF